jgi:[ribosomal protein S18]-alanine N-acetyltransferase
VSALVVAPMAPSDLDDVLAIERAQFDDPWSLQVLRDELEDPTRRYTTATRGGVLVGYLGLMVLAAQAEAHVNTIATAPGEEHAGVATALLLEGVRGLVGRGVRDVTLEVASRNLRAQRLYGRFGFAPVGMRKGYYARSGDDAVVMWVRDVDTASYAARLAAIEADDVEGATREGA